MLQSRRVRSRRRGGHDEWGGLQILWSEKIDNIIRVAPSLHALISVSASQAARPPSEVDADHMTQPQGYKIGSVSFDRDQASFYTLEHS